MLLHHPQQMSFLGGGNLALVEMGQSIPAIVPTHFIETRGLLGCDRRGSERGWIFRADEPSSC